MYKMDSAAMNHYEQQLYTVFKTFDVDNSEALDRPAVHALCTSLQLEDRGPALVDTLFERRDDRITFAQFRNGLLAVLSAPVAAPAREPSPSDEDSSGCEVAPKFVFGSKKYGRRSRPQHASEGPAQPRAASASRVGTDEQPPPRARRSASAMESRAGDEKCGPAASDLDPERRIGRTEALALCRGLSMDGVDRLVERIFEEAPNQDATVGEFFGRLNTALATTIEQTRDDTSAETPSLPFNGVDDSGRDEFDCGVPIEVVIETWESVGVSRPRALLLELGFGASAVRPPELERALDSELRAMPGSAPERLVFLAAALGIARLRATLARRRVDAAVAERDKLRGDVIEANARARLLAQEVDENHARIENELKGRMRRSEARHAEAMRVATAELVAERERATAMATRLRAESERRTEAEARMRAEIAELRMRLEEAESRAAVAEERGAAAEMENARLAADAIAEATQQQSEGVLEGHGNDNISMELEERMDELRLENKKLRDKIDELCAELEARGRCGEGAETGILVGVHAGINAGHDLSAELGSLLSPERSEENDSSPVSIEPKIYSHTEAVSKLREVLATIEEVTAAEGCERCTALVGAKERVKELGEAAILVPEMLRSDIDDIEADRLRRDLSDAQQRHNEEKQKLDALVKDLETSLEQMKSEYEKCEDYWSAKLEEERALYSEEQRLGDERLAELVGKIGEYERLYAAAARLPPIDERRGLEAQVTDLQDEYSRYKKDKEKELSERDAEVARLRESVSAERRAADELRRAYETRPPRADGDVHPTNCLDGISRDDREKLKTGSSGSSARCACRRASGGAGGVGGAAGGAEVRELRVRTARAEAAVRRLHARLAAADLLVKDLYIENCHLATAKRL